MENNDNEINQPFLSHSYTCMDIEEFNEKEMLEEYHYYEIYDPTKKYTDAPFEHDYGYGMHTYVYEIYEIGLMKDKDEIKRNKYVISNEKVGDIELSIISKHCQCRICTRNWYDLFSYFACGCCIGCLKSSFPQQYQINKTRKYMLDNQIIME